MPSARRATSTRRRRSRARRPTGPRKSAPIVSLFRGPVGLPEAQKVSTLAHELGHIHCGHVDEMDDYHTRSGRSRAETEAEATAYMTMRHWGMSSDEASSFSPGYIASWSRGDPETISKALAKATKAFQAITGLRPQAQESSS